jgi:predicted TIM-barrel fold metal-dependent hydrolase
VSWREVLLLAEAVPSTKIVVAGAVWNEMQELGKRLGEYPHLYATISHMEWIDGLRSYVDRWGIERLLFGTHAPLFTPCAIRMKAEAARLSPESYAALYEGNAKQVFGM